MGLFEKIFGNYSEKEVKRIRPIIDKINSLEPEISKLSDGLCIKNATTATIIFVADTNYVLCEHTFCENNPKKKIPDENVHNKVLNTLNSLLHFDYEELKQRHISDYQSLFKRVNLTLCDEEADYIADMIRLLCHILSLQMHHQG